MINRLFHFFHNNTCEEIICSLNFDKEKRIQEFIPACFIDPITNLIFNNPIITLDKMNVECIFDISTLKHLYKNGEYVNCYNRSIIIKQQRDDVRREKITELVQSLKNIDQAIFKFKQKQADITTNLIANLNLDIENLYLQCENISLFYKELTSYFPEEKDDIEQKGNGLKTYLESIINNLFTKTLDEFEATNLDILFVTTKRLSLT